MDNHESNLVYDPNWKSGVCWGNLAGCLTFYYSLVGFSLIVANTTFTLIIPDYQLIFYSLIVLGLIIVLLGVVLLPLVFAYVLGRQYHIYATAHAYATFLMNLVTLVLIGFVAYEVSQLKQLNLLSAKFLIADLGLLSLTGAVGMTTWITYVGRQFHEPNGQFILQL